MKHVSMVSRLPVVAASSSSSSVDVGGIIKGVGGGIASIIVATAVAVGIKTALDTFAPQS